MPQALVVDVDDFHEQNHRLDLFDRIKVALPDFKATVFAVPGLCSVPFLEELRRTREWLDFVPHGKFHRTDDECANWTLDESKSYLDWVENTFGDVFTKGHKAPGWRSSDGLYEALIDRRWWCADHPHNNGRRPKELLAYVIDDPERKLHFHVQDNVFKNGLQESLERILAVPGDASFAFIKDVFCDHLQDG